MVIVVETDCNPGELAVIVAWPPVDVVTMKVAIAEMFPSVIVATSDGFTTARSELRIWTWMSRVARVGFPPRSVNVTTSRPWHEDTCDEQATMSFGWASNFRARGGEPKTDIVAVPEAKPAADAVITAEPGTKPLV
jgi:hypothetical protein